MFDSTTHAANLLDLDYRSEASPPPVPIIDVHSHLSGPEAVRIYRDVAATYGITLTFSMSPLEEVDLIREILGDRVQFIAVPAWAEEDRRRAHGEAFLDRIREFHRKGARITKFWAAPRGRDYGRESGDPELLTLEAPHRRHAMDLSAELGMIFMTHIADPDTWFRTKYADTDFYGRKEDQYASLERLLDIYRQPWIAAHMGGWPEDLDWLDGLLDRHDNLYLDSSATKWMIRELSAQPRDRMLRFFRQWRGRILFGSDIVTRDSHLAPEPPGEDGTPPQATSPEEAWNLYASRYWALRTLFETEYRGPSPIADPDLMMVDPDRFGPLSSPTLQGKAFPSDLLASLYRDAASTLFADRLETACP